MLYIAICDDTPAELTKIGLLVKQYLACRDLQAQVTEFTHPDALLCACEKVTYDLFLLDVVMPMLSGIDVGRELRRRNSPAQLIYLTTSDEFAVDAFAVQALHYLVKPIKAEELSAAMDRALTAKESASPKSLTVRTEGGAMFYLELSEILYIESRNHQQDVYCKSGVYTEARRSLARLQEELENLSPGQFFMPYKGYLVNFRAVRMVDIDRVVLKNNAIVPMARRSFRQMQEAYFDYCFGRQKTV